MLHCFFNATFSVREGTHTQSYTVGVLSAHNEVPVRYLTLVVRTNDEVLATLAVVRPEIAHIAVYLASSESDGMTGQTITIAGGFRMG